MCGIFGITLNAKNRLTNTKIKAMISELFLLSESRGKEASGIAIKSDDSIVVLKEPTSASKLLKTKEFNQLFSQPFDSQTAIIGHARLVTNGSLDDNKNNQPVIKDGIVGIHNGIITNDQLIWKKFPSIHKESKVDTEVLLSLIRFHFQKTRSLKYAISKSFDITEGSISTSLFFNDLDIQVLATNTGSIYYYPDKDIFIFASEKLILENFLIKFSIKFDSVKQIKPNTGLVINLKSLELDKFSTSFITKPLIKDIQQKPIQITDVSINKPIQETSLNLISDQQLGEFKEFIKNTKKKISKIKRCSKCLLPETMPYIKFDNKGVCNYCHNYQKIETKGEDKLNKTIKLYPIHSDKPNCIVSFSGGRDSSFTLHYTKNILKLNPVAFSYDWGMLTDLGRRNQARMCGKLGVEHILVSADIKNKRQNIKKNIEAWLENPKLGMVPLFMAGDKQYFHYLNKLKRQMEIDLIIYGDNALEKTDFKYGFANVELKAKTNKAYAIGQFNSIKLLWYYLSEYVVNPRYINTSLFDTFTAYVSSYLEPKNYLYLFQYIKWNENEITSTLINEYNWETAKDTDSTWRIGDGTASFYNYIYFVLAGFTENDTFYSNLIREGLISRSEALKKSQVLNSPRWDSIKWYCDTIGINIISTINKINQANKLY